MFTDLITFDSLKNLAGMVAAVSLVVQVTKGVIKKNFDDWVVRLWTLIVSMGLQGYLLVIDGIYTTETVGLAFLNSLLVAAVAMGIYENIADPKAEKKKIEEGN